MILQVQYCPGDVKVTVQGPQDSPELLHLLSLLQEEKKQFWAWDERGDAVPISPKSIIWAETVDNKVFVYTLDAFYEIPMGLAELENKWGSFGFFRCAKSSVINLNAIRALRSCPGGRIEAMMATGEKVMVSRRYSSLLRERIQEGD